MPVDCTLPTEEKGMFQHCTALNTIIIVDISCEINQNITHCGHQSTMQHLTYDYVNAE